MDHHNNPQSHIDDALLDVLASAFIDFDQDGLPINSLSTQQQSNMLNTTDHANSSNPLTNPPQFPNQGFQSSSNLATSIPDITYTHQELENLDFGFPDFGEAHPNLSNSYTSQPSSWSQGRTYSQADIQVLGSQASSSGGISNQPSMSGPAQQSSRMPPVPEMARSFSSNQGTGFPTDTQFVNNPLQFNSQTYGSQASTSRIPSNEPLVGNSGQNLHGVGSNTNQSNLNLPVPSELRGTTPLLGTSVPTSIHDALRQAVEGYLTEKRAVEVKISRTLFDIIKTYGAGPDVIEQILNDLRKLLTDDNPNQFKFTNPTEKPSTEENSKSNKKRKVNSIRESSITESQTSESDPHRPTRAKRTGIKNPIVGGKAKLGRPHKDYTAAQRAKIEQAKAEKEAGASETHHPQAGPSNSVQTDN
ncbi:uncharacterized protein MELLADRAFT_102783 [Melampsora larici-populina 98AG31]|uniref:Uncharacterized protein n=1 Tax=Melampsora larici-populina (strain 98AG31 / pathotype 3-4-7) TaxID=747676 RepID=F4R9C8_MELLP|nr:uncharacterized protein MELLADRAFT_102783 [Melampsora larici-populina 98AG31]EGG11178.1 hypothetical protein MELLADRAFT_102783 [Melampsora larici-populina 98AG31]